MIIEIKKTKTHQVVRWTGVKVPETKKLVGRMIGDPDVIEELACDLGLSTSAFGDGQNLVSALFRVSTEQLGFFEKWMFRIDSAEI